MGACVGCGAGGDSGSFVKQGGEVQGMLGLAGEGLGGNGTEREGVAPGILNYHQTKFCVCARTCVRAHARTCVGRVLSLSHLCNPISHYSLPCTS